jgi:hypothetical protein
MSTKSTVSISKIDLFGFLDELLGDQWEDDTKVIYFYCTQNDTVEEWLSEWIGAIEDANPNYQFDYEYEKSEKEYRIEWGPITYYIDRMPAKKNEEVQIELGALRSEVMDAILGQSCVLEK